MANQGRPKIKWARWTIGGMVFVAAAVVLWLLFAPRPVSVEVQPVQVGPLAESVADQGYARVREAYVVSAPVSGRLERLDLSAMPFLTVPLHATVEPRGPFGDWLARQLMDARSAAAAGPTR